MYAYATQINQQERVISGAVAAGMHLMFLALLVFGVNWQKQVEPPMNVVDLWSTTAPPKAEPAPEPPPPPPPPEVKPDPKPVIEPPVKAAPRVEVQKPDIALKKDKAEKEKRAVEDKQKDAKKKEDEAQAAQKAQAAQAAEAQRVASEQAEAQRRVAEQAAAAQARLIAEYKERIRAKIQRLIQLPPNMQGNPEAEFDVVLLPDGNPLGVKLKRTSGNPAYDNAVERAILRAQPLPLPPDKELFRYFRELNLAFRPQQ
jgi:colicin import membrane protein